jgi:MFS family permease
VYELGATPVEVGSVFSVFTAVMMVSLPFLGYVSDRLKKRKIFMVLGLFGLAPIFIVMSLVNEITLLILIRGSTGIFIGAIYPVTWALVSDLPSDETIARKMGILTSSEMSGFGLGPVLGGVISDYFGFNVLWIFVSSIFLTGGLIFLILGVDSPKQNLKNKEKLLVIPEKKSNFKQFLALYLIHPIFLLGISVLGPNKNVYLVGEIGMSRTMFGLLEFIGMFFSALLQPFIGSFSDKHSRQSVMILTALGVTSGNILLFFTKNFYQTIPSAILLANYSSFKMAASVYISDNSKREERGRFLGVLNATDSASRSAGALLGGFLIIGTNIQTTILTSAIFPVLAIFAISLFLKKTHQKNRAKTTKTSKLSTH